MNEMRSYDKQYVVSRRLRETSFQNHAQLPRISDSHDYISRHESLVATTTPLIAVGSTTDAQGAQDNTKCDCILPQNHVTNITFGTQRANSYDIFGAKSESC